jgi:hypothetical protein
VKVTAPPIKKMEVRNSRGFSFEVRKIPLRFDRCAFTRGSRGEVMIFFEKNKVLGVEPNRVLNILEGI